jgi:hypothetical protein
MKENNSALSFPSESVENNPTSTHRPEFGKVLRHPALWLSFALAILFFSLYRSSGLASSSFNDSASYLALAKAGLFNRAALVNFRTLGYPAFLNLVGMFSDGRQAIPIAQFLVLGIAGFIFFYGLR